jgi:hypothetical protein
MAAKWHDSEEEFLRKIEKQSNHYHKHYANEYTYYNRLSSKFNIPILLVSAINALTAVALNSFIDQKYVSIMNAILSSGTGFLGSIQLYMKLNERMANSLRSSIAMKRIALKISKELTVAREIRVTEGLTFLQECFSEFNTTLESGNPIEKKLTNVLEMIDEEELKSVSSQPISRLRGLVNRVIGDRNSHDEPSTPNSSV